MSGRRWYRTAGRYALLTVLALMFVFPLYMMVVNSLLPPEQLLKKANFWVSPGDALWGGYSTAWNEGHIGEYLGNSVVVTTLIVAGQVVTAVLAAYAFAFLDFPLKRTLFVVFLTTMMIPFEVVFFVNLDTITDFGDLPLVGDYIGFDTYGGLALPFLATGFGAFLVRQAFLSLPRDLRDAAALDGYGHFRFLTRVAIPLARPSIAALGLFAFFGAWNQYLWPLVASTEDHRTVQVGLGFVSEGSVDQVNVAFAALVLASIPLFVLLIVFQKQLVRGLTAGAVKG